MASIVTTVEIDRPPEVVLPYVIDRELFRCGRKIGGGAREIHSRIIDFEGHGIGKVLVPLVLRRQAASEMPANVSRLKAARVDRHRAAGS